MELATIIEMERERLLDEGFTLQEDGCYLTTMRDGRVFVTESYRRGEEVMELTWTVKQAGYDDVPFNHGLEELPELNEA
jgi:hypothetical protein